MKNARLLLTILLIILLAAALTVWWFEKNIAAIDAKIENIEKKYK